MNSRLQSGDKIHATWGIFFGNESCFQLTRLYPRLPRVPLHRHHLLGRGQLLGPRRTGDAALAAGEPVSRLRGLDGVALRRREGPRRRAHLQLLQGGRSSP